MAKKKKNKQYKKLMNQLNDDPNGYKQYVNVPDVSTHSNILSDLNREVVMLGLFHGGGLVLVAFLFAYARYVGLNNAAFFSMLLINVVVGSLLIVLSSHTSATKRFNEAMTDASWVQRENVNESIMHRKKYVIVGLTSAVMWWIVSFPFAAWVQQFGIAVLWLCMVIVAFLCMVLANQRSHTIVRDALLSGINPEDITLTDKGEFMVVWSTNEYQRIESPIPQPSANVVANTDSQTWNNAINKDNSWGSSVSRHSPIADTDEINWNDSVAINAKLVGEILLIVTAVIVWVVYF